MINISSLTHNLLPELKKMETEIVQFFLEISDFIGLHDKLTTIYAYLSIHQYLTQKQICSLTGESQSTVATILKRYSHDPEKYITKDRIPGTKTYIYSLAVEDFQVMYNEKEYSADREILQPKLEKIMKEISVIDKEDSLSITFFKSRIAEINTYISYVLDKKAFISPALQYFSRNIKDHKPLNTSYKLKQTELNKNKKLLLKNENLILSAIPSHMDSILVELEDKIIALMKKSISMIYIKDEYLTSIFLYFVLRGALTQKQLRELTGFSMGTVSQRIRKMEELGIIETFIPDNTHSESQIYLMKSIFISVLHNSEKFVSLLSRWGQIFTNFTQELKSLPKNYQSSPGFQKIEDFLANVKRYIEKHKKSFQTYREIFLKGNKSFFEEESLL